MAAYLVWCPAASVIVIDRWASSRRRKVKAVHYIVIQEGLEISCDEFREAFITMCRFHLKANYDYKTKLHMILK